MSLRNSFSKKVEVYTHSYKKLAPFAVERGRQNIRWGLQWATSSFGFS